jgi:hypothetical protein
MQVVITSLDVFVMVIIGGTVYATLGSVFVAVFMACGWPVLSTAINLVFTHAWKVITRADH